MRGYKIEFNIYAESPEEAAETTQVIKEFISANAAEGRAVTAKKISDAVRKWKNNIFVKNYFR